MVSVLPRILVLALLAFALAIPATALAEEGDLPLPADPALMTAAHDLAVAHWGAEPCGGNVTVTWTHLGPGINARSQWMSVDLANALTYSACAVTYNLDVGWDWPKLCTVIEHELGHLSGHQHVPDPADIMSPYYTQPSAECSGAAPGAAPAAAAQDPRQQVLSAKRVSSGSKVSKAKARSAKARKAAKARAAKARIRVAAVSAEQPALFVCELV
jgi:hypothetical protein